MRTSKLTFKGTPIWGAARPTPGAILITRTISSIIFCISSDPISSGSISLAGSCKTGSPALTISGKLVFFFSPRPRNQPALATADEEKGLQEEKWAVGFGNAGPLKGIWVERYNGANLAVFRLRVTGKRRNENLWRTSMVAVDVILWLKRSFWSSKGLRLKAEMFTSAYHWVLKSGLNLS